MLEWLVANTQGWQVLAPALVLFCGIGAVDARWAAGRMPLVYGATWLASLVATYFVAGIHQWLARSPAWWGAMTVTAAVLVAIPIGVAYAASALTPRSLSATQRWGTALVIGLLAIPLTDAVSREMFDLFVPILNARGC